MPNRASSSVDLMVECLRSELVIFLLTNAMEAMQFIGIKMAHYLFILYPITLQGRQGTTDGFATIPSYLVLFSTALVQLAKSIPFHPLILSH